MLRLDISAGWIDNPLQRDFLIIGFSLLAKPYIGGADCIPLIEGSRDFQGRINAICEDNALKRPERNFALKLTSRKHLTYPAFAKVT